MERFNFRKLNDVEEQYQAKTSNRCTALKTWMTMCDMSRAS